MEREPKSSRLRQRLWRVFKIALAIGLAAGVALVGLIVAYRFIDPPTSTLMMARSLRGAEVRRTWIPIERMSRHLVTAVIINEDGGFCRHRGVDWGAVRDAVREARRRGRSPRGASTIPMQTAKNLFLWPQRSYLRKALEIPLAYVMSALWSKRRMMEIYLNIVEWAPNVFGAEAAARHHFKIPALGLTRRQAALMAAALPNPYVRRAGRAGPRTRAVARIIDKRVTKWGALTRCVGSPP